MQKIIRLLRNGIYFKKPEKIIQQLILFASSILIFIFSLYTLSIVLLFFHIKIQPFYFPLSILFTLIFLFLINKPLILKQRIIWSLIIFVLFILLLVISIFISLQFYDVSWDGQWYHQDGIIMMKKGWNPIYEATNYSDSWIINHYAKGSWVYGAAAYSFLEKIEAVKCFNILMIIASFCLSLAVLIKIFNRRILILLIVSSLIAFNPISVYQVFSFYLDGQLANSIICIIALFFFIYTSINNKKLFLFLLFISITLLLNYKITGTGYVLVLSLGFGLIYLIKKEYKKFLRIGVILFLFIIIGIFIYGFNPYIKNTLGYGHPFYPLNTLTLGAQPANFKETNRFEKAFYSYFSKAGCVIEPASTEFKKFFDTTDSYAFSSADTRISGFGSLFNVNIVISTIIIIMMLFLLKLRETKILLYIIFFLTISAIINPEFWWARYVPQLYLIPILLFFYVLWKGFFNRSILEKLLFVLNTFNVLVLVVNMKLICKIYIYSSLLTSSQINDQIHFLKDKKTIAFFGQFEANETRFIENNIIYRFAPLEEMPSMERNEISGSHGAVFCVEGNYKLYQSVTCDCETIDSDTTCYKAIPDSSKVKYGKITQSSEKAFSGIFSEKLTPDKAYGLSVELKNVCIGDKIVFNVKRFSSSNEGQLVISSNNLKEFYVVGNKTKKKETNGWETIYLTAYIPNNVLNNTIKVFVWNNSKNGIVFFDNLEVFHYKPK